MSKLSNSTESTTIKSSIIGRPKNNRSPSENKELMRQRSQLYYSIPENREKQRIKLLSYVKKNKVRIYERQNTLKRRKTLDKRLREIWSRRGLIKKTYTRL
jgi:ribosomal protein S8